MAGIDYEIMGKIQQASMGGKAELTRGEIASQMIDINKISKGLMPEKIVETHKYYEELCKDDEKKEYDADSLMDEIDGLKKDIEKFTTSGEYKSYFNQMLGATENLFMNSPFEGLDGIPYGVAELCVYCISEYFCSNVLGYDHKWHRGEYATSLEKRTGPDVAAFWMKLYDNLQKRFDSLDMDLKSTDGRILGLMSASFITIAAMSNQTEAFLDMATQTAKENAKSALENTSISGDGFEDLASKNAVVLFNFIDQKFLDL